MSAIVFVGPTISTEEVRSVIDARCLPPVAQGDVYRAALQRPRCIGVVDGYFHGVPSVWHKEILWAMAQGIHVFGSASMGALRAAELSAFGMKGVGRIFEDYRAGRLQDDDEVAVVHGPGEAGFTPLSEPMVNIRATLERAVERARLSAATAQALCRLGKSMSFEERDWHALLERARTGGLPTEELDRLKAWLPDGRVDLKRQDALDMLGAMRDLIASDAAAMRVDYDFEWTDMWEQVTSRWLTSSAPQGDAGQLESDLVLDELRLEDARFGEAKGSAVLRFLALREAERRRIGVERQAHLAKITEYRSREGLFHRAELLEWLSRNEMELAEFEDLMADEIRIEAASGFSDVALKESLIAQLRLSGDYARLRERARQKHEVLTQTGSPQPAAGDTAMSPIELVAWYFGSRLARPVPEDLDRYVRELGLSSRAEFYRILAREYLYLSHNQE